MWDGKNPDGARRASWGIYCAVLASLWLGACSTLDAVNPWSDSAAEPPPRGDGRVSTARVEGEYPKISSVPNAPQANSAAERREIVRGLIADRENARYTEETIRREGTPTRPLAPAAAPPVVAAPPAPPALARAARPSPSPAPQPAPMSAAQAPAPAPAAAPPREAVAVQRPAPVQEMPLAPPPPYEPSQAASAAPQQAAPRQAAPQQGAQAPASGQSVQDVFQQRLAESARQQVGAVPPSEFTQAPLGQPATGPAPTLTPPPGYPQAAASSPTLRPPSAGTGSVALARVAFPNRSVTLSPADQNALKEVARVQRQHGGKVRVVGAAAGESPSSDPVRQMVDDLDLALKRANTVARELTKLGVPARNLVVETARSEQVAAATPPRTEVFIEY